MSEPTICLVVRVSDSVIVGWRAREVDAKGQCSLLSRPGAVDGYKSVPHKVVPVDSDDEVELTDQPLPEVSGGR